MTASDNDKDNEISEFNCDLDKDNSSDNENISEFNSDLEKNVASDNDNIAEFNSNLEKNIAPNNDNDISEFNVDLAKDIESDTSGEFTHLLVFQLNGLREVREVNPILARTEAEELNHTGLKKCGAGEDKCYHIFTVRSYAQLRATFKIYRLIAGHDIEDRIVKETSGDPKKGLLAIVKLAKNVPGYFAERLYKSMKGLGTNDNDLIRIIVSRSELDLDDIKQEFQRLYKNSLESFITDDTSGDYRNMLLALVK